MISVNYTFDRFKSAKAIYFKRHKTDLQSDFQPKVAQMKQRGRTLVEKQHSRSAVGLYQHCVQVVNMKRKE